MTEGIWIALFVGLLLGFAIAGCWCRASCRREKKRIIAVGNDLAGATRSYSVYTSDILIKDLANVYVELWELETGQS